ncbi:MAG: DUF2029 domain-containing protein, partial [Chloroflexi bacterium]|nr:DUF2029 domain-containing protein [Chloroflexota bacterium]
THHYVTGSLWSEGSNPYDVNLLRQRLVSVAGEEFVSYTNSLEAIYSYPPQASAFFSLFALTSLPAAYAWFTLANLLLALGSLAMLGYILSWFRPIGLVEITLLVSLLNTGFARGNIRYGQVGNLVGFFLLACFILAYHKRHTLAGIFLALTSLKPTNIILYWLQAVLRKDYRLAVVTAASTLALTLLPVVLSGRSILVQLEGYLFNTLSMTEAGNLNDPSPFVHDSLFMHHLETLVLRLLNTDAAFGRAIYLAAALILIGVTLYLLREKPARKEDVLLDFAILSAATMVTAYHRSYDVFLLFPGLLYVYVHIFGVNRRRKKLLWATFLFLQLFSLTLPEDLLLQTANQLPQVADTYLTRLIVPFQAWMHLALFFTLVALKVRRPRWYRKTAPEAALNGSAI